MITDKELIDYSDDIINQLERNEWVSCYEIFIQSLHQTKNISQNDYIKTRLFSLTGFAIRIISKTKKLVEYSSSLSMINQLHKLPEPKSTSKTLPISEFKLLKKPRRLAILGDNRELFNLDKDFFDNIATNLNKKITSKDIVISRMLNTYNEKRLVINTGSPILQDNASKINYEVNYSIYQKNNIISAKEEHYSRTFEIDPDKIEEKVLEKITYNIKPSIKIAKNDLKGIILHPKVFGLILMSFTQEIITVNISTFKLKWNNDLLLYDDPHHTEGYYSTIFDDEGSLTKPTLLIDSGGLNDKLVDFQSTNWEMGGNGYRNSWYQPILRSYNYPISPNFTNIILYGGLGIGEKFVERNGKYLVITKAKIVSRIIDKSPQFIIYGFEGHLINNGEFLGPLNNISIYGNYEDLFNKSTISSDHILVVDKSISGSAYSGWVFLQSSLIRISWN